MGIIIIKQPKMTTENRDSSPCPLQILPSTPSKEGQGIIWRFGCLSPFGGNVTNINNKHAVSSFPQRRESTVQNRESSGFTMDSLLRGNDGRRTTGSHFITYVSNITFGGGRGRIF